MKENRSQYTGKEFIFTFEAAQFAPELMVQCDRNIQ